MNVILEAARESHPKVVLSTRILGLLGWDLAGVIGGGERSCLAQSGEPLKAERFLQLVAKEVRNLSRPRKILAPLLFGDEGGMYQRMWWLLEAERSPWLSASKELRTLVLQLQGAGLSQQHK